MTGKKNIVCQVCKRRFATQAALTQHRTASHPSGAQHAGTRSKSGRRPNRSAQASGLRKNRSFGSDLIAQVDLTPYLAPGTVVVHLPLAPLSLSTGRLGEESSLWTRWRPIKLTARLLLAGASTTFGSLMFGWTADSTPEFTGSNISVLRRVATFKPLQSVRLNQNGTLRIPTETSRKWLQTTGDVDQTAQGDIAVVISAQTGGYTGAVTMSLFLDWEVEFEGPTLGISVGPGDQTISPDAGWAHLFTTSDGSFDATRLTFKMSHGGAMVPFSSAQPGVVYTVAGDTKVPYINEQKAKGNVKYFAKVQGYTVPGLMCFSSYNDARSYITTGDITKALVFTSGGDEVTPAIPKFKAASSVESQQFAAEEAMSDRINRLTSIVEHLLLKATPTVAETRDNHVARRLTHMEQAIGQMVNPLNVHLDRGTLGTPIYTFVEDPVPLLADRVLEEYSPSPNRRPRRHSEVEPSGSPFEDLG